LPNKKGSDLLRQTQRLESEVVNDLVYVRVVNDLVYLRDPALAGFPRSTLAVRLAKFKTQNEFRKSSDFFGNQIFASLSARKEKGPFMGPFSFLAEGGPDADPCSTHAAPQAPVRARSAYPSSRQK
jgi:hypothetical protein